MANALNTLNLLQVKGGVNLKQGDVKSVLEYELGYTDDSDFMTDPKLDGKVAKVTLYNRHTNKKWTTETVVKGNRVSFTIDVPLEIGVYALDIDVEGHIFPSDRDAYVRVHEGYGSYMDGKAAIALVASAKNVADEAIRLAVLENADKIRGPKGDTGSRGLTGDTGPQGPKGNDSKVVSSRYDNAGNTIISFNNNSPNVTVQRGKQGVKGDTGNPVNVASVTKSGTTNTVKFTDGKTMKVEDGKSVNVSSTTILDDGNTEITFTDGKKAIVKKGQDGTVKFDDLTEEQKKSLQVDVVDDLTSGGSDKALSAEQGKVLARNVQKLHDKLFPPKVMTAVIDQANSNPLTCITYEDDAKMMEKGSPEWDDFFQSQLVLFKDGKEVRELEDSELNNLKPEDGDVMVRFPRKGLRIKTVGEKVYVSMTNAPDNPDFKYYAHSRGDSPRDAFYLGAYLGFEESGKLRSITNVKPVENKGISKFRQLGQAVGNGYEISGFYQLIFLQAMYVLKYGNLDSQTALGKGLTSGSDSITNTTGRTNGKGIDYGTQSDTEQMKFQHLEDFWGNRFWAIDGVGTDSSCTLFTARDKFNDSRSGYLNTGEKGANNGGYLSKVFGTSELGFVGKTFSGSSSSYYCDYSNTRSNYFMFFGGFAGCGANAGAFYCRLYCGATEAIWYLSARLMFL